MAMDILLTTLNSKYVHMNLALRYLYEGAVEFKEHIRVMEFTINNEDEYIIGEIVDGGYKLVCFSCYIWNIERILYISENIKKISKDIKIILGGPEVSYNKEEVLKECQYIDGIVAGEGELAFNELCKSFVENGEIVVNDNYGISSVNQIPFPYKNLPIQRDKTLYYESSRGCPYRCSYCISSIEKGIRELPLERVFNEIGFLISQDLIQIKFIDRTFNWDEARCYDIINFIIENDNGRTNFHFEMCGDIISDRLIELLSKARPGQIQLEIGIQSTNEVTLKEVNRSLSFKASSEKISRIIQLGNIHVHLDLIAGLPFEDFETFKESFNKTYLLRPHALQIGFLKLLKGTTIRNSIEDHGYLFKSKAPYEVISNKYISGFELVELKKLERVFDLYYNKGGFGKTLEYVVKKFDKDGFLMYSDLSLYYHEKGHQHRSHKKEDLYRILLGWCESRLISCEEIKEILRFDMSNTLNTEAVKNFERKGFYAL